jgi:hypothetical protein
MLLLLPLLHRSAIIVCMMTDDNIMLSDLPAGDAALADVWQHDGQDTGTYNLTREWSDVKFEQPRLL